MTFDQLEFDGCIYEADSMMQIRQTKRSLL